MLTDPWYQELQKHVRWMAESGQRELAQRWQEALDQRGEIMNLRAEVERLRGITPELPPRPPEGEGLPRYGLRHNGKMPMSVPMADGYWTPWHLANTEVERLRTALTDAANEVEDWAGYAPEYFRKKYDLAGVLVKLRGAAREGE